MDQCEEFEEKFESEFRAHVQFESCLTPGEDYSDIQRVTPWQIVVNPSALHVFRLDVHFRCPLTLPQYSPLRQSPRRPQKKK